MTFKLVVEMLEACIMVAVTIAMGKETLTIAATAAMTMSVIETESLVVGVAMVMGEEVLGAAAVMRPWCRQRPKWEK